ncbi:MAG: flavodoxin domain-containing protein [Clostridiales bacterium]|nr:flavodoxin domain-containing protein [Clostridiales bacterium]
MKGIVIYKSKYGSTKQYAQWISEETGIDIVSMDEFDVSLLTEYDIVVIGAYIRAGKIAAKEWLDKNVNLLKNKKIYFYTVSGTNPQNKMIFELAKATIPIELQSSTQIFNMHGKMNYKELDRIDKIIINMGILLERDKEAKTAAVKGYDHVKKKPILGMIGSIKKYMKQ